jgi:hypothetical protein
VIQSLPEGAAHKLTFTFVERSVTPSGERLTCDCRHVCFVTDVISNFIGQNVIGLDIEPITARVAN